MPTTDISTVIFDLGGVLIDWNPENLFRKIFSDEEEMNYFFENICTMEWNAEQDAGRTLKEGTDLLVAQFPAYEDKISAYYGRWQEMLGGPIESTVNLLQRIRQSNGYRLLALTNWSDETFPIALERYDFLQWFEGVLVSGKEKLKKPDPAIYKLLLQRFDVIPEKSVFIDDSIKNVEAARNEGINAIHFQSPKQVEVALKELGVEVK